MMRRLLGRVPETIPKLPLPRAVFGMLNAGVVVKSYASQLRRALHRSPQKRFFPSITSKLTRAGPRMPGSVRPALPSVKGSGFSNAPVLTTYPLRGF